MTFQTRRYRPGEHWESCRWVTEHSTAYLKDYSQGKANCSQHLVAAKRVLYFFNLHETRNYRPSEKATRSTTPIAWTAAFHRNCLPDEIPKLSQIRLYKQAEFHRAADCQAPIGTVHFSLYFCSVHALMAYYFLWELWTISWQLWKVLQRQNYFH